MKAKAFKTIAIAITSSGILGLGLLSCTKKEEKTAEATRPNIVIILADDLGYNDLSSYGNSIIKTPNIDAIGTEGVRFTQGYSTAPICSPSRSALITGRYQQRFGAEFLASGSYSNYKFSKEVLADPHYKYEKPETLDTVFKQGLPLTEITLAELLKKQGYKTGIIGKWHMGLDDSLAPESRGFDYHFGFLAGATLYNDTADHNYEYAILPWVSSDLASWNRKGGRAIRKSKEIVDEKEYLTFKIAKEATQFIDQNKEKPFLLYVPFNAPHTPFQAPKSYYDKFPNEKDHFKRVYYGMITALDDAVGQITAKLKESGLDKNTLIIFTSDNGGAVYTRAANNDPLRSGKLSQFEGGVSVPYFIKYPGKVPVGKVFSDPVSTLDIFATVAAVTQTPLPTDRKYDGVNLLPYVNGENTAKPHETLFWRNGYVKSVRKGDWKLQINTGYNGNRTYLFDLANDKSEKNNLAVSNPEKVKELTEELNKWETETRSPLWKYFRSSKIDVGLGDSLFFPL